MKILKYQLMTEINTGTPEDPQITQTFSAVSMPYSETNMAIARVEAYNGEITVEEDGEPEPEPKPTLDKRVEALETCKADRSEVQAVWEQMAEAYSEGVNEA